MMDDLPQPKDEFWLPSLSTPLPARNIPQYRPPKQRRDYTGRIIFSVISFAAVIATLLMPYTSIIIAVLLFGLALILNLVVWIQD